MQYSDEFIINLCVNRICALFKVKQADVCREMIIGVDVVSEKGVWPEEVAYDELSFDVELFASRKELKMMEGNEYKILTLGDYCDFMLRHYKEDSNGNAVVSFLQESLRKFDG